MHDRSGLLQALVCGWVAEVAHWSNDHVYDLVPSIHFCAAVTFDDVAWRDCA